MTRMTVRPPRPGQAPEPRAGGAQPAPTPPCRANPDAWDLDTFLGEPFPVAAAAIRAAAAGCGTCAVLVPAAAAACAATPQHLRVPRTVMAGRVIASGRRHAPSDPDRYIQYGLNSALRGAAARAATGDGRC